MLYISERLQISECDWSTLNVEALGNDETIRTMIVLDRGRVLLETSDQLPWRLTRSAVCTVFRYNSLASRPSATQERHETVDPPRREGRVVQLTPPVLLHFYRTRLALLTRRSTLSSQIEADSIMLLRFAESARPLRVISSTRGVCPKERRRDLISRAQALMQASIGERHTVSELARRLGTSQFHLAHLFSRDVGVPVHRYLMQLRLIAAIDRLREGARDLSTLAQELGFSHHSHFSASFRRAVGKPPEEVRRLLSSNHFEAPAAYHCSGLSREA